MCDTVQSRKADNKEFGFHVSRYRDSLVLGGLSQPQLQDTYLVPLVPLPPLFPPCTTVGLRGPRGIQVSLSPELLVVLVAGLDMMRQS